jgi:hypothetical protein
VEGAQEPATACADVEDVTRATPEQADDRVDTSALPVAEQAGVVVSAVPLLDARLG